MAKRYSQLKSTRVKFSTWMESGLSVRQPTWLELDGVRLNWHFNKLKFSPYSSKVFLTKQTNLLTNRVFLPFGHLGQPSPSCFVIFVIVWIFGQGLRIWNKVPSFQHLPSANVRYKSAASTKCMCSIEQKLHSKKIKKEKKESSTAKSFAAVCTCPKPCFWGLLFVPKWYTGVIQSAFRLCLRRVNHQL